MLAENAPLCISYCLYVALRDSQANAVPLNSSNEFGITESLGVLPLVFPYRRRLNENPCFQHDVKGDTGQSPNSVELLTMCAAQDDRKVSITIWPMRLSGAATVQDHLGQIVPTGDALNESARRVLRRPVYMP